MNLPEKILDKNTSANPGHLMKLMVRTHENDHAFYDETHFRHMLRLERMRTERSKKPFLLLLLDISKLMVKYSQGETIASIKSTLIRSLREIDICGWYHKHRTSGIIFTEVAAEQDAFIDLFIHKIYNRFCERLDPCWINKIEISFHLFPEAGGSGSFNDETFNINLYPDLTKRNFGKMFSLAVKKIIDVTGSVLAPPASLVLQTRHYWTMASHG
jgi:hypothetical protein